MNINWYPGHMAKAKRKMQESLKGINIVIEILDARIPISSTNPDFDAMFKDKMRVVILNKTDLADDKITALWIKHYKDKGCKVFATSSIKGNKKKIIDFIKEACKPLIEKYKAKGMNKVIRCMIVGIPNSGKSSFINMLCGKGKVKCEDRPGVTRSNQWIKVDNMLELMDTPGVLWPKLDDEMVAMNLSFVGSIKETVLDNNELTCKLLEKIKDNYGQNIIQRYNIELNEDGLTMMDEICKKRGFIIKNGEYDYDRCSNIVLDEYRGLKLGKISLETPNDIKAEIDEA